MEIGGRKQWKELLLTQDRELRQQLFASARQVREQWYGKAVLIRGLIEFTNYCNNSNHFCNNW